MTKYMPTKDLKIKKTKKDSDAASPRSTRPRLAVDLREAALMDSITLSSHYKEIRVGRLRAIKCRGATRILVSDLQDYLQTRPPFGGVK